MGLTSSCWLWDPLNPSPLTQTERDRALPTLDLVSVFKKTQFFLFLSCWAHPGATLVMQVSIGLTDQSLRIIFRVLRSRWRAQGKGPVDHQRPHTGQEQKKVPDKGHSTDSLRHTGRRTWTSSPGASLQPVTRPQIDVAIFIPI